MISRRTAIAFTASLSLLTASSLLHADPGNGNGKGKEQGSQKQHGGGQSAKGNKGNGDYRGNPSVDLGGIQVIIGDNRGYWSPGPALPPGIQKNLARGKSLPPGIAKKLDGRLAQRLPYYEGYDWVQAGTDLILVAVATGIITEVLHGVLD